MLIDTMNPLFYRQGLFGELLIELGWITQDELSIALYEQQKSKRLLGEELLHLTLISEKQLLSVLALRYEMPVLIDPLLTIKEETWCLLSKQEMLQYQTIPIDFDEATAHLIVAVNVIDTMFIDRLKRSYRVTCYLTSRRVIQEVCYRFARSNRLDKLEELLEWGERQLEDEDTSVMVRFVDSLLTDAIYLRASDLHCEPEASWINLRYRIDGVLTKPRRLHRRHWSALSVRLKLMAGLDIAETRISQDGRMGFTFAMREIDCRVSVVPLTHGENIVIRFLDRAVLALTLGCLGFTPMQQQTIHQILDRPYGLTLVVGPTGSGKTTTLYTLLRHFNYHTHNIMTLEDPVEYDLPGIQQMSLHALLKMDFASGVRAILRQTPDIILIGEIRDKETAIAAFQASMTGHRVLASIHAKSAMGAITRLLELGVPRAHIAANLIGLIGQRLVRRVCSYCFQYPPLDALDKGDESGCQQCADSGYHGRVVVAEIVYIHSKFEAILATDKPESALRAYQQQSGISTISEDAHLKVALGLTSQEELLRVLDPEGKVKDGF